MSYKLRLAEPRQVLNLTVKMAAVLTGICSKSPCHGARMARPCIAAAKFSTGKCNQTTAEGSKNPLFNPNLAAVKRGTGGRSSFNGMVATVFGATGFVGNVVVNRLGKIGTQMIVPYRCDDYWVLPLKLAGDLGQVYFYPFHLCDDESLRKAMRHSNVVINLIGKDHKTKNFSFDDVHVKGARRIAKIARELGVKRLVHVSALNCYPEAEGLIVPGGSEFLKSKYYGELAVREEFPDATIVRPSWTYGQGDRFLFALAHGFRRTLDGMSLWEKGEKTVKAPLYVGDLAGAIVNILKDHETAGQVFEIGGPKKYLYSSLIDYVFSCLRRDLNPGFNYKRYNLKWDLTMKARVEAVERINLAMPTAYLGWDKLEQEHTSDVFTGKPGLEELGIVGTTIESRWEWELKPFRAYNYYMEELGEFPKPVAPLPYVEDD